jgi:hypothetical protein
MKLLRESGIRNIRSLAHRYPKAEIYFHQDLDGVVSAIGMREYLKKYGIDVIDSHVIQYGDKEFSVQKPSASGDVMPVLVDFAHGKPVFTIHTDHHDSQSGVEHDTATQFRGARSNIETISQVLSPTDIFPTDDITLISTVDSADYARHGLSPDDVMNYIHQFKKDGTLPENKWLLGLLTNKLLLAYKNKPEFLESLVMNSTPSLLNIFQNIKKVAGERNFATPEQMHQNQQSYITSQKESENLYLDDNIIIQYGGGKLFKPGSYDRYTPFKIYPDADFLVIAWPLGLVQASCNPFKEDRALKGINLGDIAQEVLEEIEPQLRQQQIPISVIKRIGETKATDESIGFRTSDLFALYKDHLMNMPPPNTSYYEMVVSIIDTPWHHLSEKQKRILDKVTVSAWDVIQANSGGHKCITNISGLNFFSRATRNPQGNFQKPDGYEARYIKFVKWVQQQMVKKLKEKINGETGPVIESLFSRTKQKLIEYSLLGDALGDAVAAGLGATGIVGMPAVALLIAKNVKEINQGTLILQQEMEDFNTNPTAETFRNIEEYTQTVSGDLLDLSSRLVQLAPDPTALSDVAAFAGEQILQIGLTNEIPNLLDKIRPIIDAIPFVGQTDVVKAMDVVGEAHDLIVEVNELLTDEG